MRSLFQRLLGRTDYRSADAKIAKLLRTSGVPPPGTPKLLYWSASGPPQLFVRNDIPPADRASVISALESGQPVRFMLGHAQCRICNKILGTCDMLTHGMIYPERAEHYLRAHDVWTSECDELLRRVRMDARVR